MLWHSRKSRKQRKTWLQNKHSVVKPNTRKPCERYKCDKTGKITEKEREKKSCKKFREMIESVKENKKMISAEDGPGRVYECPWFGSQGRLRDCPYIVRALGDWSFCTPLRSYFSSDPHAGIAQPYNQIKGKKPRNQKIAAVQAWRSITMNGTENLHFSDVLKPIFACKQLNVAFNFNYFM